MAQAKNKDKIIAISLDDDTAELVKFLKDKGYNISKVIRTLLKEKAKRVKDEGEVHE